MNGPPKTGLVESNQRPPGAPTTMPCECGGTHQYTHTRNRGRVAAAEYKCDDCSRGGSIVYNKDYGEIRRMGAITTAGRAHDPAVQQQVGEYAND